MTTEKIEQLKNNILKNHVTDIKFRIDDVLSMCDSEIEKLMLLQFYDYFQNFEIEKNLHYSYYTQIEFIEDEICLWEPDLSKSEKALLEKKVKEFNYRFESFCHYKNIGFRVERNLSESISMETILANPNIYHDDFIIREFEIYPQSEVTIEGTNYRVDIAIILNRKQEGKIIDTRKIALECDGYDYHSSPEQKKNDDIRTRKLKTNGWKEVFRYSGSEIYRTSNIGEVHSNFEDIIKMLMI